MENLTDKKIDQLARTLDDANKANTSFFAKITTFSVALTGLLVGLKPTTIGVFEAKIAFMISIGTLCLCSLSSLIVQRYEVFVFRKHGEVLSEQLIQYLHDPSKTGEVVTIQQPKFYRLCELVTYICLVTAMLALSVYVYLVEFSGELSTK